jgi:hypothetical protein
MDGKQKYEVVFATGGSINVIVEASSYDEAEKLATELALNATHEYGGGLVPSSDERVNVWLGDVEDVLYVDNLTVDA